MISSTIPACGSAKSLITSESKEMQNHGKLFYYVVIDLMIDLDPIINQKVDSGDHTINGAQQSDILVVDSWIKNNQIRAFDSYRTSTIRYTQLNLLITEYLLITQIERTTPTIEKKFDNWN